MIPQVAEPDYPLEKAVFVRALATGHGRALIHAERFGAEGVRDEILDAALFPKVYDAQCNGHGEPWLARLCEAAGLVESFVSRDHGITGDLEMRCGLLAQFALRGNATARAELREVCRYDEENEWLPAAGEIVEVDGEDGFLFAADRAGEVILKHSDYWGATYLPSLLDEKAGKGRARAIMDRESPRNPNIAAFREAVLKQEARMSDRPPRPALTVDEVIEQILASTKRIPRLGAIGEKAPAGERRKVAALDFTRMEPVPLENYLIYFSRSGFPQFREDYLPLLQHPEERVRWRAHSALSHHSEPEVRQAAYEALSRGETAFFVALLCSSGLPEDVEPLLGAIHDPGILADADEAHHMIGYLLDLVGENEGMNDLRLPVWIYEFSPCRVCRYEAVKIMAERSILPQWIAEECLSDAYDDTRKVAADYLRVEQGF